jgi:ABC-2 type transport system ATP-binding protein
MTDTIIETTGLWRSHDGQPVLRGLDLKIRRGSIYGFLGRNGSGKTTTIKILAGLLRADAGEVRVSAGNPWDFGAAERQNLGYLSEKQNLPPLMRVKNLVAFCARFYPAWDRQLCEDLLGRFQIPLGRRVHKLSLGSQRLLGFILAIAPRPDVLLLDEPAANLDVVARREFIG